jgi:chromosome segregation ATPase
MFSSLQNINIWSALSLLVSSGAIGYVLRLVIKVEVLEHLFNEKKDEMDNLLIRQNTSESDILRLQDGMRVMQNSLERLAHSCEVLPQVNERLEMILNRIGQFVPKEQINDKLENLKDKIAGNTKKIDNLDAKLTLNSRKVPSIDI